MYVDKPVGFSKFPKDFSVVPKSWAETTGQLVFYKEHQVGKSRFQDNTKHGEHLWGIKVLNIDTPLTIRWAFRINRTTGIIGQGFYRFS
jgi:hypothetical protein